MLTSIGEFVEFFGNPTRLNIWEKKRDRDEASSLLAVSLNDERSSTPCDIIKYFAGPTSKIHHGEWAKVNRHSEA